jgi:hypothetical protein
VRRAARAGARVSTALAVLLLVASVAHAQDLARLFPEEADVYTDTPGLSRMPLPPEVVVSSAPDLSDVRLFDRAGREVPYAVDPGVPQGLERKARVVVDAHVSDLQRDEMPRDDAKAATREVYRIVLPDEAPAAGVWTLVVAASQPRWVRRIAVRGVGKDGTTTPLVPRASLVRLGQTLVDRDRIVLPRFDGAEIELVIEGEEGFFLEPVLRFESERRLAPDAAAEVPLRVLGQRAEQGRTVLEVARPPALASARLRFASSTPAFDRRVTIEDVLANGTTRPLGTGRITRAALPPDAAGVPRLDVDLAPARGDHLRLTIDDGDSPPLADLAVALAYDTPALLFALPSGSAESPSGVLRFGGGRAYAPRYDLAALLRDASSASVGLADASRLPQARLGAVRRNPSFDASPALAAVLRPGAAVEIDAWQWQRPLSVPESPEGLVELRLGAEDVARARADRADLRVVDGDGRQWPYLVAPAVQRASVALRATGPASADGKSVWQIALPAVPLTLDRIVLQPARTVLDRRFRLRTHDTDGKVRVLAEGTLAQDLRRPRPIAIDFPATRVDALELEVVDGDDAPIELARVETSLALPSLLVAARAGHYLLLAGNPDADAPRYELGGASAVVRDLRSVPVQAEAGRDNPDWTGTPGGTARRRAWLQQAAIWGVIGLAVAVLGLVTLRLVRQG